VPTPAAAPARVATGIAGLDAVLGGGVLRHQMYVVEGMAGAGKTTLGLHFLLAGRAHNERGLWISTAETPDELHAAAHAYGWSLAGVDVLALPMVDRMADPDHQQTLFRPTHVELDETMQEIRTALARVRPERVVLDSLSLLRDMTDDRLAYRRQVLALKQALRAGGCTALLTDELAEPLDLHVRTLAHGVVRLLRDVTTFGNEQRQVEIVKMRGMAFHSGRHDLVLAAGGLQVFPRLGPAANGAVPLAVDSTGVARLDTLLGGGLDRGTATLLVGAAGTGKSSVTMQCAVAALQRGHAVAVYLFDERPPIWFARADQLGFPLRQAVTAGTLFVEQIDPAELSPGQFAQAVQDGVTQRARRLVILDSLTGYVHAMPDHRFLTLHMHELLTWLGQHGATTLLVLDQHGLLDRQIQAPLDLSYLADTVLLFRYFEHRGAIHRAISVVKRRGGPHEPTIREMTLGPHGIAVGEPLTQFHGVLTGHPIYERDRPDGLP
jgi:circadian clock protein KaiC